MLRPIVRHHCEFVWFVGEMRQRCQWRLQWFGPRDMGLSGRMLRPGHPQFNAPNRWKIRISRRRQIDESRRWMATLAGSRPLLGCLRRRASRRRYWQGWRRQCPRLFRCRRRRVGVFSQFQLVRERHLGATSHGRWFVRLFVLRTFGLENGFSRPNRFAWRSNCDASRSRNEFSPALLHCPEKPL